MNEEIDECRLEAPILRLNENLERLIGLLEGRNRPGLICAECGSPGYVDETGILACPKCRKEAQAPKKSIWPQVLAKFTAEELEAEDFNYDPCPRCLGTKIVRWLGITMPCPECQP